MDYGTMQAAIANRINRNDIGTTIAQFINETRRDICQHHNFSWLLTSSAESLVASQQSYALPSRFIDDDSLIVGDNSLRKWESNEADIVYGSSQTEASAPTGYAIKGTNYLVYPVPDGSLSATMWHYAYPADLSVDGEEYHIDENYYETIIWGALARAAIHVFRDPSIYNAAYMAGIQKMVAFDNRTRGIQGGE